MKKKKKKKLFGIYLGEFEAGIDSFNFSGCYKLCSKKNSIHSKILMETASIFRDKGAKGMKLDCQRI